MDNFDFKHFEDDLYAHLHNMRIDHRPFHVQIVSKLIRTHWDDQEFVYKLRDKLNDLFNIHTEELLEIICSYFNIVKPFDLFPNNNKSSRNNFVKRNDSNLNHVKYSKNLKITNRNLHVKWNDIASCITNKASSRRLNIECVDYDTKGVCPRGDTCKFTHPSAALIKPAVMTLNSKYSKDLKSSTRIPGSTFILPKQTNVYNDLPNVCCNLVSDDSGNNSNNCDNFEDVIPIFPDQPNTIDLVNDDEPEITHTTPAATVFVPPDILDTPLWYEELGLVENVSGDSLKDSKYRKKESKRKSSNKSYNRSTLLVYNIPPELNSIGVLNKHFRKFGTLTNITVSFESDPSKALVEFRLSSEMEEANKSELAVLGNRFIKTRPYKSAKSHHKNSSISSPYPNRAKSPTIISQTSSKHRNLRQKTRRSSRSVSRTHKHKHSRASATKSRNKHKSSRYKRRHSSTERESDTDYQVREKRRRRFNRSHRNEIGRRHSKSRDDDYYARSTSHVDRFGREKNWRMCGTRDSSNRSTERSRVHSRLGEVPFVDLENGGEPLRKEEFVSDGENQPKNKHIIEATVPLCSTSGLPDVIQVKQELLVPFSDDELNNMSNLRIAESSHDPEQQQQDDMVAESSIPQSSEIHTQLHADPKPIFENNEPLSQSLSSINNQTEMHTDVKLEKALNDADVQESDDEAAKRRRELELATRRSKLKAIETKNSARLKFTRLRDSLTFYKALLEAQISQFKRTSDKEIRSKLGPRIKENHELFVQLKTQFTQAQNGHTDSKISPNKKAGSIDRDEEEVLSLQNNVAQNLVMNDDLSSRVGNTIANNDDERKGQHPMEMLLRVDGELDLDILETIICQSYRGVRLVSSARLNSVDSRPHLFSLVCLLPSVLLRGNSDSNGLAEIIPLIQRKLPSSWKLSFPRPNTTTTASNKTSPVNGNNNIAL